VDDKRISETSSDMASPPTATQAATTLEAGTLAVATTSEAGTPVAATPVTTTPTGNPTPTTTTTRKTEAQAPRRTRIKTLVKKKLVKSYKLGPPFTTYPKKRRKSARVRARIVKSRHN